MQTEPVTQNIVNMTAFLEKLKKRGRMSALEIMRDGLNPVECRALVEEGVCSWQYMNGDDNITRLFLVYGPSPLGGG